MFSSLFLLASLLIYLSVHTLQSVLRAETWENLLHCFLFFFNWVTCSFMVTLVLYCLSFCLNHFFALELMRNGLDKPTRNKLETRDHAQNTKAWILCEIYFTKCLFESRLCPVGVSWAPGECSQTRDEAEHVTGSYDMVFHEADGTLSSRFGFFPFPSFSSNLVVTNSHLPHRSLWSCDSTPANCVFLNCCWCNIRSWRNMLGRKRDLFILVCTPPSHVLLHMVYLTG